jgi:hypothetical protein
MTLDRTPWFLPRVKPEAASTDKGDLEQFRLFWY